MGVTFLTAYRMLFVKAALAPGQSVLVQGAGGGLATAAIQLAAAAAEASTREAIIESVFFGQYIFARGILPRGMLGFNPQLIGYPYDPQTARELLAAAGYPGGRGMPPVVIWSGVMVTTWSMRGPMWPPPWGRSPSA